MNPDIPKNPSHRAKMIQAVCDFRASKEGVVDVSTQHKIKHHIIAELLFAFAHQDRRNFCDRELALLKPEQPAAISFRYEKGRMSQLVPLFCLPAVKRREADQVKPLRVSLISMRHLQMDHIVDFDWLVSRQLPQTEDFWEKDQYSYERTKEQLEALARKNVRSIHLYQTGYPAPVIGFYRALIEYQRNVSNFSIEVTPYYFDDNYKRYRKGSTWS